MSRPALILCDEGTASLRIAGLSLLDRTLVAAHRAGFGPIMVVSRAPLPPISRAQAWRIPFAVTDRPPDRAVPTLVVRTTALLQATDFQRLNDGAARLIDRNGESLPAALVPPGNDDPEVRMMALPERPATEVAASVRNEVEARRAAQGLWSSLKSSSDGLVDRVFDRPVGRPLSKLLVRTPVTPNAISLGATAIGILAAGLFAMGRQGWSIVGAVLFQISAIIDCVDGDVARAAFKESPLGKWLDVVGDQVVHIGVFAGIAFGLWRGGAGVQVGWLGLVSVLGAALCFLVVMRDMHRGGNRPESGAVQRLLAASTNRDFSALVLLLACVNQLVWFLWLAAIGSQVFWVLLVVLQRKAERAVANLGTG